MNRTIQSVPVPFGTTMYSLPVTTKILQVGKDVNGNWVIWYEAPVYSEFVEPCKNFTFSSFVEGMVLHGGASSKFIGIAEGDGFTQFVYQLD